MQEPLSVWATKLQGFAPLTPAEEAILAEVERAADRRAGARTEIASEGDPPRALILIVEGWAARTKMLPDGRRQIVDFLLPGSLCDLNACLLARRDHTLCAITAIRYAELSPQWIEEVGAAHPRIMTALRHDTLVNAAIQREWTVNLGQRTASERIAHLMCELYYRLRSVGLADAKGCTVPLTQMDLAEATGMTSVHVNRTLQLLRARDILRWNGARLDIPDLRVLEDVGLFTPDYLQLPSASGRPGLPVKRRTPLAPPG